MADTDKLLGSVISGLLTGSASVLTTVLAVFRDTRKRIEGLEKKLGSDEESQESGLFAKYVRLDKSFKEIRRQIDDWDDQPPQWAQRLFGRGRMNSSVDIETQQRFEDFTTRFNKQVRELTERFEEIEESVRDLKRNSEGGYVSEEEYQADSRKRAQEIIRIKENLAAANGMLRGVMSSMGYLTEEPSKKKGF